MSAQVVTTPNGDQWYNATIAYNGVIKSVRLEPRAANMTGEFDLSVKLNNEVIF